MRFAFARWDWAGQEQAGGESRGEQGANSPGVVAHSGEVLVASERRPGVGVSPIGTQHINRRSRRRG